MYNETAPYGLYDSMEGPPSLNSLIYWYWGHSDDEAANANQVLGKWYNGTNDVIRIANCIQNVKYGTIHRPASATSTEVVHPGSDWVECAGYSLFAVSSLTCGVLYSILLAI